MSRPISRLVPGLRNGYGIGFDYLDDSTPRGGGNGRGPPISPLAALVCFHVHVLDAYGYHSVYRDLRGYFLLRKLRRMKHARIPGISQHAGTQ